MDSGRVMGDEASGDLEMDEAEPQRIQPGKHLVLRNQNLVKTISKEQKNTTKTVGKIQNGSQDKKKHSRSEEENQRRNQQKRKSRRAKKKKLKVRER